KWLLHEYYSSSPDRIYTDERVVYYSPSSASDSLEVTLMITDNVGCHDTTTRLFPIIRGDVWAPSAFTPDGNNNNLFKIGTNHLAEFEIFIYSRSGLLVFHSNNPEISWNGTHNYKPCPPGAYSYIIKYTLSVHQKQPLQKVGSVLLVR
ncbi:MAG: gliding motility-associated C-terminal domain-containing protein, partial [Bacteroidales bacterium]|nr:gliding motility-associated C-terminal domain-containing protein [Bacteroidales bacterium]